MAPELLLIEHGRGLAGLAALAVILLGALIATSRPAIRAFRESRCFLVRMRGAQRGLERARAGDRVAVLGVIEAIGATQAIDRRALRRHHDEVRRRAAQRACARHLPARRRAQRREIVGAISVDGAARSSTLRATDLGVATLARLADADVPPDGGAITSRSLHAGDRVLLLGRWEPRVDLQSSYRSAQRLLKLIPDDDGAVHALGLA